MKLVKCHVSSFGKIKNYDYDFDSGLNTIKEDNGWGKSTLATFIKAMFYGVSSGKRSVAENERIKYKPWNSTERFGGSVTFEWGGKTYIIERFFGAKEAEDTVRLFDADTGKEYSNTENLGKRVFEIDEEGFLSTTYFSQKDFQIKSNSSITAKFNSVCENQNTEAFDKALDKLEERAKEYKYRGDKGKIPDLKRDINAVEERIKIAEKSIYALEVIKGEVQSLESKTAQLKKTADSLTEKVGVAGKAEAYALKKLRYDELNEERQELTKEKDKLNGVLNGNLPDDDELNTFTDCYNDLILLNAEKKAVDDQVNLMTNKPKENARGANKNLLLGFVALACLLLVVGVVFLFVAPVVGVVSLVLFVGALVALMAFGLRKNSSVNNAYEIALNAQLTKQEELAGLEKQGVERLKKYLSKYNLPENYNFSQSFELIKQYAFEMRKILLSLEKNQSAINVLETEKSQFTQTVPAMNVQILREQLKDTQEEYTNLTNLLASKKASVKTHEDVANSIPDLESKKEELTERLKEYFEEHRILTLTYEYLQKADENLKVKYRKPLQDSLNKYLSFITGRNSNAVIDIDLNVTVTENEGSKVTDYYSKGYQNLFEICKRFALTDVLFTGEKPFVVLDDPFYNLDDDNLKGAIELIKKLSEEYQILYFVCHESRRA